MTRNQAYVLELIMNAGKGTIMPTGKNESRMRTIRSLLKKPALELHYLATGGKVAVWLKGHPGFEMCITGEGVFGPIWGIVRKEGPTQA